MIAFLYYNLYYVDSHMPVVLKIAHYYITFMSYYNGMSTGNFNRKRAHSFTLPYEKDGIQTKLIQFPHYQQGNFNVTGKLYFSKNPSNTILLYFHGGGFVQDEYKQHDDYLRDITKNDIKILSVLYRLAPEHKFPIPVHDSYSALVWVNEEMKKDDSVLGKIERIVIAGDSAGGNLASITTIMNKDLNLNLPISKQILIYPWFAINTHYPEDQSYYCLTSSNLNFYIKAYLGENPEQFKDSKLLNPMNYKESLSFLPKTIIIVADYDPLLADGELYHQRLLKDDVDSKIYGYKTVHGFAAISFESNYQNALDLVVNEIKNI